MIIAGTGHRPQKFVTSEYPWADVCDDMRLLACDALEQLPEDTVVISGMALGWDQELADAAQWLGLPVWAYIPFRGQEGKWNKEAQKRYNYILNNCAKVVVCSHGDYNPWKMQVRNEHMVDAADVVLALWDGSSGGTGNCVQYATQEEKPIWNVYPEWVSGEEVIIPDWLKGLAN